VCCWALVKSFLRAFLPKLEAMDYPPSRKATAGRRGLHGWRTAAVSCRVQPNAQRPPGSRPPNSQLPVRRSLGEGGSTLQLLNPFLKLLTDHCSVEAIDGDACLAVARRRRVKPLAFFPFHHEVSKTCDTGFVVRIPRRPIKKNYGSISKVLAGSALKCSIAGEKDRRSSSN